MPDPTRRKVEIRIPPGLALVLVAVLLFVARDLLIPIALAIFVTFLLTPPVRRLERAGVPRVVAVLTLVLVMMGVLGALGWVVERQAYDLATQLPDLKTNIQAKFKALRPSEKGVLGRAAKTIAELGRELDTAAGADQHAAGTKPPEPTLVRVVNPPTPPLSYARTLLNPVISPLATVGVVIVFSFFMLSKREDLRDRLIRLIGPRTMHLTTPALDDAAQRITHYLTIQVAVNATAGVVIGVGLFFLGVPGAAVWGLLTALLRFVPYVGTWIAGIMPVIVSLAVSPGWMQPLLCFGLIAAVELSCSNLVEPLVFRSGTGLSPLAILAAAVFWAWLWGPVGLVLATPLTVCLAVIGRHVPDLKFLDVVLRDEPGLTPHAQFYQRLLAGDQHEAGQIIEAYAKDKSLVEVYDGLVLPALRLVEMDRHRHDLDPDTERSIQEMLAAVVEDTGGPLATAKSTAPMGPGGVLCLPARDWADELAAGMLSQLLAAKGVPAQVLSSESLSGELVSQVEKLSPAAVCVSAVPPAAAVHIRVLCKRLRARFPDLPIVAGLWDGPADVQSARMGLGEIGTDFVATSLAQAVDQLQRLSSSIRTPVVTPVPEATPNSTT